MISFAPGRQRKQERFVPPALFLISNESSTGTRTMLLQTIHYKLFNNYRNIAFPDTVDFFPGPLITQLQLIGTRLFGRIKLEFYTRCPDLLLLGVGNHKRTSGFHYSLCRTSGNGIYPLETGTGVGIQFKSKQVALLNRQHLSIAVFRQLPDFQQPTVPHRITAA